MFSKRRGSLLALGSLLTVTALGSWGCCSVTCCDKKPRNQLVLVPEVDANWDKIKEIVIKKSLYQEIVWKLPAQSTLTYVEITPRDQSVPDTLPFENCKTNVKPCQIECQNRLCPSGAINPALSPPKTGFYYDYTFKRPDSTASADPGIRIDP